MAFPAQSFTYPSPIPSGTVVLFYQAAAPVGWTQVTSLNDYALRLVSSAGGTVGGTTAYSTVFSNQTPTITVGSTTLSTAQMPSHTHYGLLNGYNGGVAGGGCYDRWTGTGYSDTGAAGGGGSHNHSGSSSAITLNVRYANIIICSKN